MRKVILISGASSGIGYSSAKRLIEEGHIVYCGSRNIYKMKELELLGGRIVYLDVCKQITVDKVVKKIIREVGRIDVLFSNAGYVNMGNVELVEVDDVNRLFNTNVFGLLRLIKCVLPHMRKVKDGRIVVTSSISSILSIPGMGWYPASKSALDSIVNSLRLELKPFNIKVSIIEPNYTDTNIIEIASKTSDKVLKKVDDMIYLEQQKNIRYNFINDTKNGICVEVISKLVSKCINSSNPKYYYRTFNSWIFRIVKRFFPQKVVDYLIVSKTIKKN